MVLVNVDGFPAIYYNEVNQLTSWHIMIHYTTDIVRDDCW